MSHNICFIHWQRYYNSVAFSIGNICGALSIFEKDFLFSCIQKEQSFRTTQG